MNELLADALQRLLADHCTPQAVRAIEAGAPSAALWQRLEESGFADAIVAQAQGGSGLSLPEVYPLVELCGVHCLPLPLAETMLARSLLAQAGVQPPPGSVTLCAAAQLADGAVQCQQVACGRVATWALAECGAQYLLLSVEGAAWLPAAFALDATLTWPADVVADALRIPAALELRTAQGCIYAAQLAGALMAVFQRSLRHANDRVQFGRPIGKFQAIQHQLSLMAEHAFAARMAAQIGCNAPAGMPQRLCVAVAKARASEAALEVAGLAHAIHGAIGFTAEFDILISFLGSLSVSFVDSSGRPQ